MSKLVYHSLNAGANDIFPESSHSSPSLVLNDVIHLLAVCNSFIEEESGFTGNTDEIRPALVS